MTDLPRLVHLNLDNNALTMIPNSIFCLTLLQEFSIGHNKLSSLPASLGSLPSLQVLQCVGNIFTGFLHELIKWGNVECIKNYLHQSLHTEPLRQIKLMLLGHGYAGKTTLKDALMCDSLDAICKVTQTPRSRTPGIQTKQWKVRDDFTFTVWDFGGQIEYSTGHRHFITEEAALYVLVLNPQANDCGAPLESQLRYWLTMLEAKFDPKRMQHSQESLARVVIVCSHGERVTPEARIEWRDRIRLIVEEQFSKLVFARDEGKVTPLWLNYENHAERVVELQKQCVDLGREQVKYHQVPQLYARVLAGCISIGDQLLKKEEEPLLSRARLVEKLVEPTLEAKNVNFALTLFDRTGHIMLFGDVVFLQPQWLFNTVATFVAQPGEKYDKPEQAILTLDHINLICKRKGIKSDSLRFTQVLESFQLCHEIRKGVWFFPDRAPSLDPHRELVEWGWWHKRGDLFECVQPCLGVRLHFGHSRRLPPAFFHAFQVRLMGHSKPVEGCVFAGGVQHHRADVSFMKYGSSLLLCRMITETEQPYGVTARGIDFLVQGADANLKGFHGVCSLAQRSLAEDFPGIEVRWQALCPVCIGVDSHWRSPEILELETLRALQVFHCTKCNENPDVRNRLNFVKWMFDMRTHTLLTQLSPDIISTARHTDYVPLYQEIMKLLESALDLSAWDQLAQQLGVAQFAIPNQAGGTTAQFWLQLRKKEHFYADQALGSAVSADFCDAVAKLEIPGKKDILEKIEFFAFITGLKPL